MDDLERHMGDLQSLGVENVVFTGGEPLLNPDLFPMAARLRVAGIRITVLTSGLLLARFADRLLDCVDEVIVSLDGPQAVHDRIRGVIGAFDALASGIRALRSAAPAFPVSARCTIQRANHHAAVDTVRAAHAIGLRHVSFLAADASSDAFNHDPSARPELSQKLLLTGDEIATLERQFECLMESPLGAMVAESPAKLRRIVDYFRALDAQREPVAPPCNAPWISAVLGPDGSVRPCFFHSPLGSARDASLRDVLNGEAALRFRESLDVATNPVCRRCVCSLYRPEWTAAPEARTSCA
jgi:MoaA/NifB/PqqE/SkfB family radical SAM enzyme